MLDNGKRKRHNSSHDPGAEERSYDTDVSQSEKADSDQDSYDTDVNELEDMQPHCPVLDALL